jgi:RNA polymerase sigma-70 factor (ECF subfamily)
VIDDSIADSSPGVEEDLSESQLLNKVQLAFAQLEPIYREVFILRDVEGLSAIEVSEKLGISIPSVKSRLHRARNEVRLILLKQK